MDIKQEGRCLVSRFVILLVGVLFLFAGGCGTQDGATTDGGTTGIAALQLLTDKDAVIADGSDVATLTVRAFDAGNVVVEGAVISISTTAGALSLGSATTDATGSATFTFDSGNVVGNRVATITASTAGVVTTKSISIVGASVSFTADRLSVGLNGVTTSLLTVQVQDGGGAPVENQTLSLSATLGTFAGSSQITLTTDVNGQATATYAGGSVAGTDTLTLVGPETKTLQINISGQQFNLTDSQGREFGISANDQITLTWTDNDGTPVAGEPVLLGCSRCTFDTTGNNFLTAVTDASGQVSTVFNPISIGNDRVTVTDSVGSLSDSLDLTILSITPDRVILSINPSVLARTQGSSTPTSTLKATVLDDLNRAVQGVDVSFSILESPGGGESLFPVIAKTNESGLATTSFTSGSLVSAQNGVRIMAKVVSAPDITDVESLTISDQAATVVLGESNVVQILTQGAVPDTYALPITVLVTDTNGSAMANQNVSLSLFPLVFYTGRFDDVNNALSTPQITGSFLNEDVNRNGILDPGEEDPESFFADGHLQPGGVASIPSSVTTDENGFAGFDIVYAKSYGGWVSVEISATASVSGTESRTILETGLAYALGDVPYINSPFGSSAGGLNPQIVWTTPENGATSVPENSNIVVAFDSEMISESVTVGSFSVSCGGTPFNSFFISHDVLSKIFTLNLSGGQRLPAGQICNVTVSGNVRSASEVRMGMPYDFSFTTQGTVDPGTSGGSSQNFNFTGQGDSITDAFAISEAGNYRFDTSLSGDGFVFFTLKNDAGDTVEVLPSIAGDPSFGEPQAVTTAQLTPGTFYIEATGSGRWSVGISKL